DIMGYSLFGRLLLVVHVEELQLGPSRTALPPCARRRLGSSRARRSGRRRGRAVTVVHLCYEAATSRLQGRSSCRLAIASQWEQAGKRWRAAGTGRGPAGWVAVAAAASFTRNVSNPSSGTPATAMAHPAHSSAAISFDHEVRCEYGRRDASTTCPYSWANTPNT